MANNWNNKLDQSTNPLAFTTNGQNRNNSLPTAIRSNESSLRVEYASTNKDATSYLTYACNFTQSSTGTHNLKWTFTPNHNTKGYIKNDGIKINLLGRMPSTVIDIDGVEKYGDYVYFGLEKGKGTASNPMPVEGGIIAFNISGVSYDCARGRNTNRLVSTTRYYKFPANASLNEDGTGNKEISISSNIGQEYTNTYSPSLSLSVSTSDTYLHTYTISKNYIGTKDTNVLNMIVTGPIDYSPYDETRLKHLAYNGTNYAYIDSNLGIVKKGTCTGLYTAHATTAYPEANSRCRVSCNTSNLSITQSDNSQAKTNPRRVNLSLSPGNGDATRDRYKFASFDKITLGEPYDTVTIYQDGGNLRVPNPSTSMSWEWVGDSAINAWKWGNVLESRPKTKIINNVTCEIEKIIDYIWDSNAGTKASVGGTLISVPSKLTQADNEVTKNGNCYYIKCPDNTGSEITIELSGHTMTDPVNTSSRSLSGKFLIACVNDAKGTPGSLSNEIDDDLLITLKRKVPFTITQRGRTNPEPSFTIQQNISFYSSNPDTSVMPTVKFNNGSEKAGQGTQVHTITGTGTQKILMTIPNTRHSVVGASIDYKTSTINNSRALQTITASGGTVDLDVTWNYTIDDFHNGYIPESGEYNWHTYFHDINTSTNVDGKVTNNTTTIYITQPGNSAMYQGNYDSATISIGGVYGKNGQKAWGSLSIYSIWSSILSTKLDNKNSLRCTRVNNGIITSAGKFRFTANSNNATISMVSVSYNKNSKVLTVTHNGVSSTAKEGYCNLVKNVGGLQYEGQTDKVTNSLGLYYKIAGESYGGKISISTSKASGSGDCGSVSAKSDIDLTTVPTSGKNFSIYDLVTINNGTGNYDSSVFKLPTSVTIPANSTYYVVECPAATVTKSTSSTWNVYGKITGTVNSSLNNTFPTGLTNGLIGSVSTVIVTPTVPNNYYFWWDPVSNDNKATMTSNKNVVTIHCQANTGGSGYVNSKADFFGDGYWIKLTGGRENKTDSRKLGTLRAGFGTTKANATSSVDVWQNGMSGGNIPISEKYTLKFFNCDGGKTEKDHDNSITVSLSSSSLDDPDTFKGYINSYNWDCYDGYLNKLYEPLFDIILNNFTKYQKNEIYNIGAFDNNISNEIGIKFNMINNSYGILRYNAYIHVYDSNNKLVGWYVSVNNKNTDISDYEVEITWSDGVITNGFTRQISISNNVPGKYTYKITRIKLTYTYTSKFDYKKHNIIAFDTDSYESYNVSAYYTWTFTVDSKHYYNS